jgi:deoxyribodipyrimidine photolyase-related protein
LQPSAPTSCFGHIMQATLIFPHQIFQNHPAIATGREVYLVEEFLFFSHYPFHKRKIALHRASMQAYAASLRALGYVVHVVEAQSEHAHASKLPNYLKSKGITEVHYAEVVDDYLQRRLTKATATAQIEIHTYPTPMYLNNDTHLESWFGGKKRYFQADFYTTQRKRLGILMEVGDAPVGGKWSFDTENRLKYPKGLTPPIWSWDTPNAYHKEAIEYTNTHFSRNFGDLDQPYYYPVTHSDSKIWLDNFLATRFRDFGAYEDAMVVGEVLLNHSMLTPMLNIGLLTPKQVVDAALSYAQSVQNTSEEVPLASLEGFIRQVIGWREFIRGVYVYKGRVERTRNFWGFEADMPAAFYNGTTGILPVDDVIKKLLKTGYSHHIERLMILGNFLVLCEIRPNAVYQWFMELYVDAYDWVMVPNVYGMSQYADGGVMSTKPYISGSNYVMKMSNYPKGDWQIIWDALFWRFLNVHRVFFLKNPRMGMLVKTFDKMSEDKQNQIMSTADAFLEKLHSKK